MAQTTRITNKDINWTYVTENPPKDVPHQVFENEVTIILPASRYQQIEEKRTIRVFGPNRTPRPVTLKHILSAIHNFYQETLNYDKIIEYAEKAQDDADPYLNEALDVFKHAPKPENIKYPRSTLMGDCIFFEGLERQEDGYLVLLGS